MGTENAAIKIDGIGKKYVISHVRSEKYLTMRDAIAEKVGRAFKKVFRPFASRTGSDAETTEEFWALRDISFEIGAGERIGIIGRNGAGKSTMLKILSRVTEPTEGEITLRGRVASLLEVGTGFHPELTGRENIYLNGAILGMSKSEIDRKFDEIVAFSEVEKFLDTPVKRFSSGMYVRLAFAVAAHLEPEILIVDEVLAVGDAQFQKKCLGKMSEAGKEGRTVLFVSHNMAAVRNICQRAILLNGGRIETDGDVETVTRKYEESASAINVELGGRKDRQGNGRIVFTSLALINEKGENAASITSGRKAAFSFAFENRSGQPLGLISLTVGVDNSVGERICAFSNEYTNQPCSGFSSQRGKIEIHLEKLPLIQGRYGFTLFCTVNGELADWVQNAGFFDVNPGDYYSSGRMISNPQGSFFVEHTFKFLE